MRGNESIHSATISGKGYTIDVSIGNSNHVLFSKLVEAHAIPTALASSYSIYKSRYLPSDLHLEKMLSDVTKVVVMASYDYIW